MDEREAKDGDQVADHSDDDTAYGDSHIVVGDSRQDLPDDNNIDDCETAADNDIEEGAELSAIETKRVSRSRNCTKTSLSSISNQSPSETLQVRRRRRRWRKSHLRPQSARVRSAQRAQHGPDHNSSHTLLQAEPKLGPQNPNGNSADMAGQTPPEKEDVDDAGRPLILLLDAINALRLDAHLLIQPFLAAAQAAQEAHLLLQLAREDLLCGAGIDVAGDAIGGGVVFFVDDYFLGDAGLEVFLVVMAVDDVCLVTVDEIHGWRAGGWFVRRTLRMG